MFYSELIGIKLERSHSFWIIDCEWMLKFNVYTRKAKETNNTTGMVLEEGILWELDHIKQPLKMDYK